MSILIKGMEMPTDCALMLKIFPDGKVGVPVHRNWVGTMVVKDAEAIAVPPHGRLGDLDKQDAQIEALIERHLHGYTKSTWDFVCELRDILKCSPTIIEEEGEKK